MLIRNEPFVRTSQSHKRKSRQIPHYRIVIEVFGNIHDIRLSDKFDFNSKSWLAQIKWTLRMIRCSNLNDFEYSIALQRSHQTGSIVFDHESRTWKTIMCRQHYPHSHSPLMKVMTTRWRWHGWCHCVRVSWNTSDSKSYRAQYIRMQYTIIIFMGNGKM